MAYPIEPAPRDSAATRLRRIQIQFGGIVVPFSRLPHEQAARAGICHWHHMLVVRISGSACSLANVRRQITNPSGEGNAMLVWHSTPFSMLTACLVMLLSNGVAQAFDIDAIVKVAPSRCLNTYSSVITIKDGVYDNGITVRSIANTTIDFRGVTVRAQANSSSAKSMTIVRNFNNVCVLGGRHWGKQDPQVVPWTIGHKIYGAGLLFKTGAGSILLENAVIENSLQDGITLGGDLASNTSFGMRGVRIENTSDDGIQNDGGKKILFIEDSLIESKMGLSMRPGADSNTSTFGNYKIPIRHSLFNIICVADDRVDGSCGPGRSASSLFKSSGAAKGVTVEMTDSIVRYEARPGGSWSGIRWLPGTYRNVIFVWDPETPGLKYAGPSWPAGVTFTTDPSV